MQPSRPKESASCSKYVASVPNTTQFTCGFNTVFSEVYVARCHQLSAVSVLVPWSAELDTLVDNASSSLTVSSCHSVVLGSHCEQLILKYRGQ